MEEISFRINIPVLLAHRNIVDIRGIFNNMDLGELRYFFCYSLGPDTCYQEVSCLVNAEQIVADRWELHLSATLGE